MQVESRDALLIIDVQNDFCPGGALAVAEGDQVIEPILRVAPRFAHVVLTQDWHPAGHISFASSHQGRQPLEQIELPYGAQTLWPAHCVQGSLGAAFHPGLQLARVERVQQKGAHPQIDSYSAFFENDRSTATWLGAYLQEQGIARVFLAGLAYDYCVGFSALDARRLGLEAVVLRNACRAIDLNGSVVAMNAQFAQAGVQVATTLDF